MFEREAKLNAFMFGFLQRVLQDVEDTQLALPISENGNPPLFILGHLAVTNDYALRIFGEQRVASAEWHKRFRPGASPKDDTSPYPSKAELVQCIDEGCKRVRAAAAKADPEKMSQPQTSDFFKGTPVETIGDAVAHLMTTHPAFHLGQLSAWRRSQGKAPMF